MWFFIKGISDSDWVESESRSLKNAVKSVIFEIEFLRSGALRMEGLTDT